MCSSDVAYCARGPCYDSANFSSMQNNHENVLDSNNNKRPLNKTRTFAYLSLEVINGRLISNELWTVRRLISTQYLFNKTVQKGNEKNHVCHVRGIKKIPYAPSLLWEQVAFWSWMIHPWSVITRSFHQKDTLSPNWLGKSQRSWRHSNLLFTDHTEETSEVSLL